eukprot:m.481800 g.481800  ORF g.481800 m.481800 type:complete len:762 (+) comp22331_c0_seq1:307-2592(+)
MGNEQSAGAAGPPGTGPGAIRLPAVAPAQQQLSEPPRGGSNDAATLEFARDTGAEISGGTAPTALNLDVVDITTVPSAQLPQLNSYIKSQLDKMKGDISRLSANNYAGFASQYTRISAGLGNSAEASANPAHRNLNRYANIVAYDHSRVKLTPNKANNNSDYINASWINGYDQDSMYIAAQGPVPDAFPAFWQMVWETHADMIVMVTNEVENGRLKCHRYWPDKDRNVVKYGNFTVQFNYQEVQSTYVTRHFSIQDSVSNETRDVVQYAYTAWPDHGVPATTTELLEFRHELKKRSKSSTGPMLIHCSAGVGRTGTFIGVDRFLDAVMQQEADLNILPIVEDMRHSRNFMVQSQIQFVYLHLCCLDGLERLSQKVEQQMELAGMSTDDRQAAELEVIATAIETTDQVFQAQVRAKIDARHEEGGHADDLPAARRVSHQLRTESLMSSATADWKQKTSVPLSPDAKGYDVDKAAAIEHRMTALAEQQEMWLRKYHTAQREWIAGEVYETKKSMAPLESRLQSLASADEAWRLRGDGFRSAQEEDTRRHLADLTARLESLQMTIMGDEERWRARHRNSQSNVQAVPAGTREHTVDRLGTLLDRVGRLALTENDWTKRGNVPQYLGKETFVKEVQAERAVLEARRREQTEAQQQQQQQAQDKAAQEKAEAAAYAKAAEEKKEQERREAVKAKMRRASESPTKGYDPVIERKRSEEKLAKEQRKIQEKADKEARKRQEKEAKEAKRRDSQEAAKKKASRFLNKMK